MFVVTLVIVVSSVDIVALYSYLVPALEVICIYGWYVAFEVHISCWQVYGNSMVKRSCNLLFLNLYLKSVCRLLIVVQWDIYVPCGRHYCSGVYANNVKCMYTSASDHIVDCSMFIWGIYTDIAVSCAYELICLCSIWQAYLLLVPTWQ